MVLVLHYFCNIKPTHILSIANLNPKLSDETILGQEYMAKKLFARIFA